MLSTVLRENLATTDMIFVHMKLILNSKIVLAEVCGVADMKLLDFNVRLNVYALKLRRLLSIVIRCASLFGVGDSGRSPVSSKNRCSEIHAKRCGTPTDR